jgi:hypothetical protein
MRIKSGYQSVGVPFLKNVPLFLKIIYAPYLVTGKK